MTRLATRTGAGALLALSLVAVPLAATRVAPATAATTPACNIVGGTAWRLVSASTPCRVVVAVGGSVRIRLSSSYRWTSPRRTSGAVSVTSTRPAGGGLTGVVRATRVGGAVVSFTGGVVCPPGQPCPLVLLLWSLRVSVVAHATSAAIVTATEVDAGSTFTLRVNDRFVVSLTGPAIYTWTVPTVSDPTVLQRQSGGPGHAVFVAVGPGSIMVTATDNPNCYPACLPPSRLVQFHVKVI